MSEPGDALRGAGIEFRPDRPLPFVLVETDARGRPVAPGERVKVAQGEQETEVAQLRAQASGSSATLGRLDGELQRLRRANEMLSATNVELRNALEQNVGEPHLINKAMLAELEALRAARAADMAENQLLLDTLEPLLAEAASEESA